MKTVRVRLETTGYDIHIGPGLLVRTGDWLKELGFRDRLVVITDSTVRRLYGDTLVHSLSAAGFNVTVLAGPEGEGEKSLETAGRLCQELTDSFAERMTPILALGGGVIGDVAGFVAATYLRGVPLVHLPTTLLAQADSSLGGKTGVDHGRLKNKIGAFYQPGLTVSDTSTLKSLPLKLLGDGLAEVIKHAAIRDAEFFTYLEDNLDRILALDDGTLEAIVARSAQIKAEVVEKDERDLGLRNILNYGHTIGHAIETVSDFGIEHGQAVAIGMLAAARISNRMGFLDSAAVSRLSNLIKRAGLPTEVPRVEVRQLIETMQHDKKIVSGRIRFVLLRDIGDVFVTDEVSPSLVEEVLAGRQ